MSAEQTPDIADLAAVVEILRANGLTDRPEEFDGDIHSWRCSHPDIYGRCDCFQELAEDLAAAVREAEQRAWDKGYTSGHSNAMRRMSDEPNAPTTPNPYRADRITEPVSHEAATSGEEASKA